MYNEQLEKLIEMALMDGELTEKEKQILFKKAESFGVDLDEFEMVLEARLYEKQQSMKTATSPAAAAPKSDKFGDVKKCPACGSMVQTFQTKCSDCGHEFSNIEANVSIDKLFKMLNDIENERKDDDNNSIGQSIGNMFAKSLGGNSLDRVIEKKKTLITSFPVPNTKNDILEFLSLTLPNASVKIPFWGLEPNERNARISIRDAWKSKCEQIIMKARFSMKDDKKTLEEIEYYAKQLKIK